MIIDIPRLQLDKLIVCYLRGEILGSFSLGNTLIKVMINQIDLKNTFKVEKHTTTFCEKCRHKL